MPETFNRTATEPTRRTLGIVPEPVEFVPPAADARRIVPPAATSLAEAKAFLVGELQRVSGIVAELAAMADAVSDEPSDAALKDAVAAIADLTNALVPQNVGSMLHDRARHLTNYAVREVHLREQAAQRTLEARRADEERQARAARFAEHEKQLATLRKRAADGDELSPVELTLLGMRLPERPRDERY